MSPETDISFIETQFPVSKLSKESYKERKANYSQTLTGLGKWWGRKPLIMVRAAILGLLLPASQNPKRDREIFLKLLTMDPEGLWRRKTKAIALADLYARLAPSERERWFDAHSAKPRFRAGTKAEDKARLQRLVFDRMGYDERLVYCDRPEQIDGPSQTVWAEINAHLGTDAASLPDLVRQLGQRRFGHTPRVGDAFCGGGSVPFEAARMGCDAYGSDLNPVAALLTWGALNIVGGGEAVATQIREEQQQVFGAVDRQVTDWRIEHNDLGWRADAYLYCTETRCPECGWMVPLAPSWVIGEKTHTLARLTPDPAAEGFAIEIHQGVTPQALAAARAGTVHNSRLECPHCRQSTPMAAIRGDRRVAEGTDYGLRQWENADLVPRPDDTFQERLYCIRWRLPGLADLLWAEQNERAGRPCTRPVPGWVPLDGAIAGLADLLDASDRLDLTDAAGSGLAGGGRRTGGSEGPPRRPASGQSPQGAGGCGAQGTGGALCQSDPAHRRPQGPRRPAPRNPLSRGGGRGPGAGGAGPGLAASALRRLAGQGVHPQPPHRAGRQDRRAYPNPRMDVLASSFPPQTAIGLGSDA